MNPRRRGAVLFTSPILEYPPAGGPALRILNSIKALQRVTDAHVISRVAREEAGGSAAEAYLASQCAAFSYAPSVSTAPPPEGLRERGSALARRIRGKLALMAGIEVPYPRAVELDAGYIVSYARRHRIDVVWFGYGNISHALMTEVRRQAPRLKLVCDTDSVWSRFVGRELPFESDSERRNAIESAAREKAAEEMTWSELCDAVTAVSSVDAEYYRSVSRHPGRIHVFSNGIDLDDYRTPPPPPPDFRKPCVYLAGTFAHPRTPMDRAARWVVDEILPLLWRHVPDLHFYIVGRDSDKTWSRHSDARVIATGKLPSVLPYLTNVDVALVPLKFESGTRFKILEAGACRVPIVSTTLGAEGLRVADGEHLLIADTASAFASAILRMLSDADLRRTTTTKLNQLVRAEYSVDATARESHSILRALHVAA